MKTPQLDPYHLIVFYYVARGKSLSAAARDLYLSQPAITSHIKSLERSAGLKLIQVVKQRVTLTPAGEGLFPYAKEIYNQSVGAERFIEVTRESGLSIGVTSLFSSIISPLIEKIFYELPPNMRFSVVNKESQFLIEDVLDATIDLAIILNFRHQDPRLSYLPIAKDVKLAFYASPDNPVFRKDKVEWKDLADYPLITGSHGSFITDFVLSKLKQDGLANPELRGPHIINNPELCKRLATNGKFIGLACIKFIEEELNDGDMRVIALPEDITVNVSMVFYQNILLPDTVKKLIVLAREAFASFTDSPLIATTI